MCVGGGQGMAMVIERAVVRHRAPAPRCGRLSLTEAQASELPAHGLHFLGGLVHQGGAAEAGQVRGHHPQLVRQGEVVVEAGHRRRGWPSASAHRSASRCTSVVH